MSNQIFTGRKSRRFPADRVIMLLGALLLNEAVYYGARLIAGSWPHAVLETAWDARIPFLPWTVCVYFGCFLFWTVNYCLCAGQSRERCDRFFCADALAKLLCFVFFLLIPTTNHRPEITGTDFWSKLMRLLYRFDAPDNLFPSIHCLVSWLCWVGVRNRADLPRIYRWASLAAAVAVCLSTLTTRQHVIADVAAGIALAELCHWLSGFAAVRRVYARLVDKIAALSGRSSIFIQ